MVPTMQNVKMYARDNPVGTFVWNGCCLDPEYVFPIFFSQPQKIFQTFGHSYYLGVNVHTARTLHTCTKLHFIVEFTDKILCLNDSCALLKGWRSRPLINFSAVTRVSSSWIIKGLHWSYSSLRHEPHLTFDTAISLSVEHTATTCVSRTARRTMESYSS